MAYITKTDDRNCLNNAPARVYPVELADNLDGIAPAGMPIMSACLIVEKMDVAVCNGRNEWYRKNGDGITKITAGQPWTELF